MFFNSLVRQLLHCLLGYCLLFFFYRNLMRKRYPIGLASGLRNLHRFYLLPERVEHLGRRSEERRVGKECRSGWGGGRYREKGEEKWWTRASGIGLRGTE